jgi:hypothetical protein
MDVRHLAREPWKSTRIAYVEEWRLLPGLLIAAVGYPIWVGATGGAVTTIADFVGFSLALDPWTGRTTAVAVVLAMFWVVVPAAVATHFLLERLLTNGHGNLRTSYRLRHPLALLLPPVALLAPGFVVGAVTDGGSVVGEALLALGAVSLSLRVTAYAYRVFALSLPLLAQAVLFLSVAAFSVAVLAAGAMGAGRTELVADAATGIAGVLGAPALAGYTTGTVTLGGVGVSMLAATVLLPALVSTAGYVGLQLAVSGIQRLRGPNVKRSSLRTGQHYPGFARPSSAGGGSGATPSAAGQRGDDRRGSPAAPGDGAGTETSPAGTGGTGGSASTGSAPGDAAAASGGTGGGDRSDDTDDLSHTRVYSPPEDTTDIEMADAADATSRSGTGTVCPSCDETREGTDRTFCPTCGSRLEDV